MRSGEKIRSSILNLEFNDYPAFLRTESYCENVVTKRDAETANAFLCGCLGITSGSQVIDGSQKLDAEWSDHGKK